MTEKGKSNLKSGGFQRAEIRRSGCSRCRYTGQTVQKYGNSGFRKMNYGVLKDRTIVRLRQILNDLLVKEYLWLTPGDYPVLKLREKGRQFLQEKDSPQIF